LDFAAAQGEGRRVGAGADELLGAQAAILGEVVLGGAQVPAHPAETGRARQLEGGYGLTFGLHTRIDARVEQVSSRVKAGNIYVNRNQIGAVVGSQPFGGEGLSGTGPKAGGPHYLYRFCAEQTLTVNTAAAGGNVELLAGLSRE